MTWVHIVRPHEIFSTVAIGVLSYFMWKIWLRLKPNSDIALEGMADALNTKSPYYSDHCKRVALISNAICDTLSITGDAKNQIIQAAKLHDLGKLFLDEDVLHEDRPLTDLEWSAMKLHPVKGGTMARNFGVREPTSTFVLYHHENLDGTGYPLNLRDSAIPRGARILRIADSIDAMAMPRPYREAFTFEKIEEELHKYAGIWYDEGMVKSCTNGLAKRIKLIILNNS